MKCFTRRTSAWMSVTAALLASAGAALAMPAVMDRVPQDALMTIAVPNFSAFKKDLQSLGTLMQLPVQQGLDQFGLLKDQAKGLKQDGSVAVVVFPPAKKAGGGGAKEMGGDEEEQHAEPIAVVLVPVTNYAEFLGNFGAKAGGGVDAVQIEGEPAFAKDLGDGFAALAKEEAHLARVDGKKGQLDGYVKAAGKAGNALADRSDLIVSVNVAVARPLIKAEIEKGLKGVEENAGAMPNGADPAQMMRAGSAMINEMVDAAQGITAGLNIDNLGVSLDSVTAFSEGSRFAKIAATGGKASALLAKLPQMPYLVAGAMDLTAPGVRDLMLEWSKAMVAAVPKDQRAVQEAGFAAYEKIDGAAGVIGVSPAGLMGGLLANGVSYLASGSPDEVIKASQATLKAMVDAKTATGKYEAEKQEIDGVKVDLYEYRLLADPNNPGMAMGAGMIFGPTGGPAGYVAKVDGGVIQTMGKNTALVSSALKAVKGENGFSNDKTLAQIGEKLPANRSAEAYISVKDLLNQLLPMAAMFGAPVTVDVPQNLPPIGAGIAPADGSVTASIYVPAPVLKTLAEVTKQVQAAMPAGGQAEDKPEGGQPQF